MKVYKCSTIWLSILTLCSLGFSIILQTVFNKTQRFDFLVSLLVGLFSSGFITLIFSIVAFQIERKRAIVELAKQFALAVIYLQHCSGRWSKTPINLIKYYDRFKNSMDAFFSVNQNYSPFSKKSQQALNIENATLILSELIDKVAGEEHYISLANYDNSTKLFEEIYSRLEVVFREYKDRVEGCLNILAPDVKIF